MRKSAVRQAIKHYFKTTTLHGFKYLYSSYHVDKILWLLCFCASACCAGVLCAVLWARFLEVPALLTLWDNTNSNAYMMHQVPAIVVCPPTESVADMFLDKLSQNKTQTQRIPVTLSRLLNGKSTARDQLLLLEELLVANNLSLSDVMMNYTPSCNEHTKRCRYHELMVPCEQLFEKTLTIWGLCCVMRPKKLRKLPNNLLSETHSTKTLDLMLQCTHGSKLYGCQFYTIYESEEYVQPSTLLPGYYYRAQLRFTAIPDSAAPDDLVTVNCVSEKGYSRTFCLLKCAEKSCGCSDPLHSVTNLGKPNLPMCPITRMGCLRNSEYKNEIACNCLPSCNKITTDLVLEASPMNAIQYTTDKFYYGINATPTIVVNVRVNVGHSRIFVLNPSETWLTLLSSLGGVFNMFLGVGLFSALEFLFLVLVKLPIAVKKSSEIDPITTIHTPYTTTFDRY